MGAAKIAKHRALTLHSIDVDGNYLPFRLT